MTRLEGLCKGEIYGDAAVLDEEAWVIDRSILQSAPEMAFGAAAKDCRNVYVGEALQHAKVMAQ